MTEHIYRQSEFLTAAVSLAGCPPDTGIEVAIAGRSNAGKSSVVNMICGRRSLARVSRTPGRTRELLFFEIAQERRLVDLPGYGYARAPASQARQWPQLIESYFAGREALQGVLLVMDIRHPLQPLDEQMLAFCEPRRLPVHVLLNKADKLSRGRALQVRQSVAGKLGGNASVALLSCQSGMGRDDLRRLLDGWFGFEK
jgi:GTP-binding protein